MVNQCKFLNIALGVCSEINAPCAYMADPLSCSLYDEESTRPYHSPFSPPYRVKVEEVEETEEEVPDWF